MWFKIGAIIPYRGAAPLFDDEKGVASANLALGTYDKDGKEIRHILMEIHLVYTPGESAMNSYLFTSIGTHLDHSLTEPVIAEFWWQLRNGGGSGLRGIEL